MASFFIVFFIETSIVKTFIRNVISMVTSIVLIVWWLFACYGLIVANMKSIKDEFDAIIPYQWIAWILLMFFFIKDLFTLWTTIELLQNAPLFWILQLISMITKLVLWFVLSYWWITKYILTAPTDTKEKTDSIYKSLIWIQVPFGIIAIVLWLLWIIFAIIY